MSEHLRWKALRNVLDQYDEKLRTQLFVRWKRGVIDLSTREVGEVAAALLARQTRLGIEFARSPRIWNSHVGPVVLRTMVDLLINLKWIAADPVDRSRKFVLYGLGQAKLQNEHRKIQLEAEGHNPDDDPMVAAMESWMDGQRFSFLTEVDVGNWSGLSVREMAQQAECLELLNYSYAPFSAATHSMWHHVGRYNVIPCASPLHRHHLLPSVGPDELDLHYLEVSAKYVERAFELYEISHALEHPEDNAYDWLLDAVAAMAESPEHAPDETSSA